MHPIKLGVAEVHISTGHIPAWFEGCLVMDTEVNSKEQLWLYSFRAFTLHTQKLIQENAPTNFCSKGSHIIIRGTVVYHVLCPSPNRARFEIISTTHAQKIQKIISVTLRLTNNHLHQDLLKQLTESTPEEIEAAFPSKME